MSMRSSGRTHHPVIQGVPETIVQPKDPTLVQTIEGAKRGPGRPRKGSNAAVHALEEASQPPQDLDAPMPSAAAACTGIAIQSQPQAPAPAPKPPSKPGKRKGSKPRPRPRQKPTSNQNPELDQAFVHPAMARLAGAQASLDPISEDPEPNTFESESVPTRTRSTTLGAERGGIDELGTRDIGATMAAVDPPDPDEQWWDNFGAITASPVQMAKTPPPASPRRWLLESTDQIKFEVLTLSERGTGAASTRDLRLDASKCESWEWVRAEVLDTVDVPRKHQDQAELGLLYGDFKGKDYPKILGGTNSQFLWEEVLDYVAIYLQDLKVGKSGRALKRHGRQPLCFKVMNTSKILNLQGSGERHKDMRGSKRKSRPKDREDFSHVYDGNNSHLSENDDTNEEDEEDDSGGQSRGKSAKRAKKNTLEREHEGEVEKIRSEMRRLSTEFWVCQTGKHKTACIEQDGRCTPLSNEVVKKWAQMILAKKADYTKLPAELCKEARLINKDPNATRKACEGSVPILGGNSGTMPINLNIQLSGGADGARPAANTNLNPSNLTSNQPGGLSSNTNDSNPPRQSAQRIRRLKNLFPTIAEFLIGLDSDPDNAATPRNVQKYTELLTSSDHLGYGRIHELIIAIQNSSTPGADWLKERIERAAKDTTLSIRISEGTASFIYEEMLDTYEEIISQNASM